MTDARHRNRLLTSIYLKTGDGESAPADESCYYLLTSSGLFIGRNQPFMRSLVPSRNWPGELEPQKASLTLRYPKVPADLLGRIVGFFWTVAQRHGAEAAVLLAFNEATGQITPIVPDQTGTIGCGWHGEPYPIGLHYEIPIQLDDGLRIIGDIHSHAFEPAYASSIDVHDEVYRPGLHVVAGRLDRDPPEWHVEYVVDGTRFPFAAESVLDLEGYTGRTVPAEPDWLDRLEVLTAAEYTHQQAQNRSHTP